MENGVSSQFEQLADDLREVASLIHPSEYHGMVSGRLAANSLLQDPNWEESSLDFIGPAENTAGRALSRVLELPEPVAVALRDPDFSFQLLLPGEDWSLDARIAALGHWCEGFLLGLALGGLDRSGWDDLSPELAESMTDLAAIAQVEERGDGDEGDFEQLYEYVRMVVLTVCAERRESDRADELELAPQPTHSASHLFGKSDKLH